MTVAVATWDLLLPGCASLKEKRMVVKSLKDRINHRFKVSIAETAKQDTIGQAELTVAVVSPDRRTAESIVDRVDRFIQGNGRAVIQSVRRELL